MTETRSFREILEDIQRQQDEERQAWEYREKEKQDELEAIERNRRREAPSE